MNNKEAIEFVLSIPQGAAFLENNHENDVFIKELEIDETNRIAKEYPGIFPFKKIDQAAPFSVISILVISRNINKRGYPKLKVYYRPDTKEVLRILTSE